MKKTISLLLLGLLCSIGTIRAGELTIVGTTFGDKTTTGQTVKIHTNTDSQNAVAKFESNIISGGAFAQYYKIETSGGFKSGDVVTFTHVFNNSDNSKVAKVGIFDPNSTTPLFVSEAAINGRTSAADPTPQEYTLTADYDYLYLGRFDANTTTFLLTITVTRTIAETATAKWDWQNDDLSAYDIDAIDGTKDITINGLTLHICAATPGIEVKLVDRGTDAQMTQNTEIQVPVQSTNDIVTVVSYPGYHYYTVAGTAATNDNTTYSPTMREVAQGYVSIVATNTAYLYNVEVKQFSKGNDPSLLSLTAGGETYYADELEWEESPAGTFSTTIFVASVPVAAPTAVAYNGNIGALTYSAGAATIPVTLNSATTTYVVTLATATVITVVAGEGGTVSPSGVKPVATGSNLVMTATPNTGYYFVNWTNSADQEVATTASWTAENITADETYTAHFASLYSVTYGKGSYEIGTQNKYLYTNVVAYADKDGKFTMPANYAIVYNAANASEYTLTAWTDGVNNYTPGVEYTLTGNLTLTPVFTANTEALLNSSNVNMITWAFNATPFVHVEGATGYYVQQAKVNGSVIDVPMFIQNTTDATGYTKSGKFVTSAGRVQARNTKLTIPAITGMKVIAHAQNGTPYKFRDFIKLGDNYPDGSTESDAATALAQYTYSGANGTVDICFYTANDIYLKSIVVIYPVTATGTTVTLGENGWSTYAGGKNYTVSGATVYKAAYNEVGNYVALTEVAANTVMPEGEGVILKGTEGETATITFTNSAAVDSDFDDNELIGVAMEDAIVSATGHYYVLSTFNGVTAFNPCGDITIPIGKALMQIIPATPAPDAIRIEFNENDATDIKSVEGSETAVKFIENGRILILKDGVVYDALGRMVR